MVKSLLLWGQCAALALALGPERIAWAAPPPVLTSLKAIHALTNSQASQQIPVAFEATVTFYRNDDVDLFVQDEGAAIYVSAKASEGLNAGDRVRITGKTQESFRPIVIPESITLLHRGSLPEPIAALFEQLNGARLDCLRVTLRAVVRSADMVGPPELRGIYLRTNMDGGSVDVAVNSTDLGAFKNMLDAEVQITGVATAKFDQRMELAGARIDVQSPADMKILRPAHESIGAIPFSRIEDVYGSYRVFDYSRRVRVQGAITYYQPGSTVVIQNGAKSLRVLTMTSEQLWLGDLVEVTGFPELHNEYPTLNMAEIRDTHVQAAVTPLTVGWQQLGFGGNAFNLVTTEGTLVRQVREAAVDQYFLEADGHLFSAIFRHPPASDQAHAAPMNAIPLGSRIRVTGIGMFYTPDPFNGPVASDVLLRSVDDIVIVAGPSWFNTRNLMLIAGLLLAITFAVSFRGWALEHRVRRQTAVMAGHNEAEAALERQRSQILEDITLSRPLTETLAKISRMLSFQLQGAPCWCEIANGAVVGDASAERAGLLTIRKEILSRSGARLGMLNAALDPASPLARGESEEFAVGIRLATLAIETNRLYADLHHRSEFDQLTEVHNRFSLNQYIEDCIAASRQDATIFGLIYLDLDEFKQINDVYGHHIGDLFLQQVAQRFKQQLRSHDMLARLGGDEFAALISVVRTRAGVEEVAQRLLHCFDEPFVIEGLSVRGSASLGIAIYPVDGASREALLEAADTAMYSFKRGGSGADAGPIESLPTA